MHRQFSHLSYVKNFRSKQLNAINRVPRKIKCAWNVLQYKLAATMLNSTTTAAFEQRTSG